jgi:prepilin-type N-terminal cleavage/methylation domain-containing protein
VVRQQSGVSIIELIVVISVVAIMVTVVMPGFSALVQRNSMVSGVNGFIAGIQIARSEAINRGTTMTLQATDASDGNNEWGPGWTVRDGGNNVVRTFQAITQGMTLDSLAGANTISFNSRGLQIGNPNTLDFCITGQEGVRIAISATGRTSTSALTVADCP